MYVVVAGTLKASGSCLRDDVASRRLGRPLWVPAVVNTSSSDQVTNHHVGRHSARPNKLQRGDGTYHDDLEIETTRFRLPLVFANLRTLM